MTTVRAVLFDLDGTLLDTIPDLAYVLNTLRKEHDLPEIPIHDIRPIATLGSVVMIKNALGIEKTDPTFHATRERFLSLYSENLANLTVFFPGVEAVLDHLDNKKIPWGIVTNKLTIHTEALLKALNYHHRPACVLCGDTLSTAKPDPAPILRACELISTPPKDCLYVGDSITDVQASKSAGTKSIVALYGYIDPQDNPQDWKADGYIEKALDIMKWL